MASFPTSTVLSCPHVMAVANDPRILALAGTYLGCKPTISQIEMGWSYPADAGQARYTQVFHRDYDDWRFLKLFVYLTAVYASAFVANVRG